MAPKNKWMAKLAKLDGAVVEHYDPFAHVIRTPSPSVNFLFGRTHGLPLGYGILIWGPPKGGKSVIANAIIGQLHRDDPEAIAIKYNTEMREQGQLTREQTDVWGIDPERYMAFDVNEPDLIFDKIEKDVKVMCDEGAPIKLIIIDSLTGIQGRRAMNADTIMTQQIGDEAKTLQDGLKRILPVIRRKRIAVIGTAHARAELDQVEQMRGKKTKMAAAWATKHFFEYFMYLEPFNTKEGRTDLFGEEFINEQIQDALGKGEKVAHRIRVHMEDSSVGPKGRWGVFTLDYNKGIVNTFEEVFLLGTNRGIITQPSNAYYEYGGEQWHGKKAILTAMKGSSELCDRILADVRKLDVGWVPEAAPVEESAAEESK